MTHTKPTTPPTLPTETIQHILTDAWAGPLTPAERIGLMATSARVSTAWATAFTAASARDAHIPSAAAAVPFLARLAASPAANDALRTLTFHLTHTASMDADCEAQHALGDMLSHTLYALSVAGRAPHLRRVSIRYTNFGSDDAVRFARLFVLPPQVTMLAISYDFDAQCAPKLVAALRARPARNVSVLDRLPHVRHLAVFGAGAGLVVDLMNMCTEAEDVVTDVEVPKGSTWFVPVAQAGGVNTYTSGVKRIRSQLQQVIELEEKGIKVTF